MATRSSVLTGAEDLLHISLGGVGIAPQNRLASGKGKSNGLSGCSLASIAKGAV